MLVSMVCYRSAIVVMNHWHDDRLGWNRCHHVRNWRRRDENERWWRSIHEDRSITEVHHAVVAYRWTFVIAKHRDLAIRSNRRMEQYRMEDIHHLDTSFDDENEDRSVPVVAMDRRHIHRSNRPIVAKQTAEFVRSNDDDLKRFTIPRGP